MSPPVREAWIEICSAEYYGMCAIKVASREGGVD